MLEQAFDAVFTRTLDGQITYWNKGAESLFGFSAAEAVGRKSYELLHTIFPPDREAFEAALAAHGAWHGELRRTCKDGRVVVVESRMSRDADEGPVEILEVDRDIPARATAETTPRTSNWPVSSSAPSDTRCGPPSTPRTR